MRDFVSAMTKDIKKTFPEQDISVLNGKLADIKNSADQQLESKLDDLLMASATLLVAPPSSSPSNKDVPSTGDLPLAEAFPVEGSIGLDDDDICSIKEKTMKMLNEGMQAAFDLFHVENEKLCTEKKAKEAKAEAARKIAIEKKKVADESDRLKEQNRVRLLRQQQEDNERRERIAREDSRASRASRARRTARSDTYSGYSSPSISSDRSIAPRCKDGSLDMRFKVNRGKSKYGSSSPSISSDRSSAPRCKDGSLDMRFKVNRGKSKYGFSSPSISSDRSSAPRCKDGSLDMRFKVNRGKSKYG
jgi:hypothetical protein